MNAVETVIWDCETAGLEPHHATIQIAALAVLGWQEVASFQVKIRFDETKADADALLLNCYDAETWKRDAIEPELAIFQLDQWLSSHRSLEKISARTGNAYKVARIAGWNVRFDCERIERGFKAYGKFLPAATYGALDLLQVARGHFWEKSPSERPENLKLPTVAKWLGLDVLEAHDALADVRLTMQVAQRLLNGTNDASRPEES